MTMTDPIADMLTRIRNANSAYHEQVVMPFSKLKGAIADAVTAGVGPGLEARVASLAEARP